jgi:hypothetical protein
MPEPRSGFDLRLPTFPVVQLVLLALMVWVFAIGGTVTFGTWGEVDTRILSGYLIPALALHAWSGLPSAPRLWPRVLAWALVFVMLAHSQVLLQPVLIGALGLLAALDLGLHAARVPKRERLPLGARVTLGITALLCLAALWFLWTYATFEALTRLGAAVVLAAALVVAGTLYPSMRMPTRLLPALGAYYLFVVLVAAPILPFGPAIAWWLLCGMVLVGAVVSARHVSGEELPERHRRHEHAIAQLPDPLLAHDADLVERFLATGAGSKDLSLRVERATGREAHGKALAALVKETGGPRAGREHRAYALRRLLEMSE